MGNTESNLKDCRLKLDNVNSCQLHELFKDREEKEPTLSFSGCGFLGFYHIGVATALAKYGPQLIKGKIAGASAGALAAAALISGASMEACMNYVVNIANKANQRLLGTMHPEFEMVKFLEIGLMKLLPDDAHISCTGRLFVSVTRFDFHYSKLCLGNFIPCETEPIIVSNFPTKTDLIRVLVCSAFVPLYCGFFFPRELSSYYFDGGVKDNQPRFNDDTITISPLSGTTDICPMDNDQTLLELVVANFSMQMNEKNMERLCIALFPSYNQYLEKVSELGYKDAIRFLQKRNLITCDNHYRVMPRFITTRPPMVFRKCEMEDGAEFVQHIHASRNDLMEPKDLCNDCQERDMEANKSKIPVKVISVVRRSHQPLPTGTSKRVLTHGAFNCLQYFWAVTMSPIEQCNIIKYCKYIPFFESMKQRGMFWGKYMPDIDASILDDLPKMVYTSVFFIYNCIHYLVRTSIFKLSLGTLCEGYPFEDEPFIDLVGDPENKANAAGNRYKTAHPNLRAKYCTNPHMKYDGDDYFVISPTGYQRRHADPDKIKIYHRRLSCKPITEFHPTSIKKSNKPKKETRTISIQTDDLTTSDEEDLIDESELDEVMAKKAAERKRKALEEAEKKKAKKAEEKADVLIEMERDDVPTTSNESNSIDLTWDSAGEQPLADSETSIDSQVYTIEDISAIIRSSQDFVLNPPIIRLTPPSDPPSSSSITPGSCSPESMSPKCFSPVNSPPSSPDSFVNLTPPSSNSPDNTPDNSTPPSSDSFVNLTSSSSNSPDNTTPESDSPDHSTPDSSSPVNPEADEPVTFYISPSGSPGEMSPRSVSPDASLPGSPAESCSSSDSIVIVPFQMEESFVHITDPEDHSPTN